MHNYRRSPSWSQKSFSESCSSDMGDFASQSLSFPFLKSRERMHLQRCSGNVKVLSIHWVLNRCVAYGDLLVKASLTLS